MRLTLVPGARASSYRRPGLPLTEETLLLKKVHVSGIGTVVNGGSGGDGSQDWSDPGV